MHVGRQKIDKKLYPTEEKGMIKGAQRQMIVVKTDDNRFFEEAYFVVRPNVKSEGEDMVSEAYKVIDACTGKKKAKRERGAKKYAFAIAAFCSGSALGALLMGLINALL